MELLKVPRGIYFGSVKGNFGNGKNVDLQGLTVLINDSISNYRRTSDFHASAILVERGSLLSHSAIVSRELGKPCIVGITGLLNRLKTGDWVEMDGSTGQVKLIEPTPIEKP
jgi:pyruvate,water dikinase